MGLIQKQYEDLRKKIKKSHLENQWRAFKETRNRQERLVVKSKSNISKEIGLTHFLNGHGIEVIETDIGDRIIQIAGHRASHATAPAVHLSRYEIAEILSQHLKREVPPAPEEEMQAG